MALSCRIVYLEDGTIDYINTEKGGRSKLFDDLVRISNKTLAYDMYALTETEEFKELQPAHIEEPSLEEVVTFATRKNSVLDDSQIIDVDNTVVSSEMTSYGELFNRLKEIYMKNGVVVFDRKSLENSGFYNKYEVESIMNDTSLQDQIRSTIIGLSNTDNDTLPDYDPSFIIRQTSRLNSTGKQEITNPFIVEQQVIQTIAGTDVQDSISNIPYENIKNKYFNNEAFRERLDNIAESTKNVVQKEIIDGELVDKSANRTLEILTQTLDLGSRESISQKVFYILNIGEEVWNQSTDSLYTLLSDINKTSISAGVDFMNLEDYAFSSTREEIVRLLSTYINVLNSPSDETLNNFVDEYSQFFQLNDEPLTRTVTSNDPGDIYLETDLTEYQLFSQLGLVKKGENLYREVEVMDNLDDVYLTMMANPQLLPAGITTESELRDYVNDQISETPIPDFEVDMDVLQKMILYKMYFGSNSIEYLVPDNTAKYVQFSGDYDYLTQEYPSDFYKDYIREKRKNSDMFKNFYSNFTITSKGIELVNKDPLTIRNIMRLATDDLLQYNMVSKNLGLPVEETMEEKVDFNQMIYNREQAINNPDSVIKLKQDYAILSPVTIAVKNAVDNFVRTPMGIFEIDYQIGNVSFYNMLPEGNSSYNAIGLYKSKTQSDLNLDDFTYLQDTPEAFIKAKNYYSEAELKRINETYFNC